MPNASLFEKLQLAEKAARDGASVAMEHYHRGVEMRAKLDTAETEQSYNLVSQADLDSEQAIAAAILAAHPDHVILGEESHSGDIQAEHLWVVDPIDGTNNFAHHIPLFAVSVAYYHLGKPQVAVVLNPATDHCYSAALGEGATMNGNPIQVSSATRIDQAVVNTGFYYDRGEMMQTTLDTIADLFRRHVHGIRRFGSAALDLCMVASGQCEAYFEYRLAPWDFAGGQLILAEAGGKATDCHGNELPITHSPILATNGHLHAEFLSVIKPYIERLAAE